MPDNATTRRHVRLVPKCSRCGETDPPEGFRANGYCHPCGRKYEADRRALNPAERKAIRHRSYLREKGIDVPAERPGPKAVPVQPRTCPQCQQLFTPRYHTDPSIYCATVMERSTEQSLVPVPRCIVGHDRTTILPRCKSCAITAISHYRTEVIVRMVHCQLVQSLPEGILNFHVNSFPYYSNSE